MGSPRRRFRDSNANQLWPNELETCARMAWRRRAGTATYRTPFGRSAHTYTIGDYSAGQGFTYATGPEHPLRGGGRVLWRHRRNGTTLVWTVDYTTAAVAAGPVVRLYFVPRFFARLEANCAH